MDALKAFEAVDFQWTQNLDSVWVDSPYDVASLHQEQRGAVLAKVGSMAASAETGSPLGWVLVGPAGYGKTHLLASIRREVLKLQASFVLVNMIDVRDFWETALLGFLDALQRPGEEGGLTQGQLVIRHLVAQLGGADGAARPDLTTLHPHVLARHMDDLVQYLGRTHRPQTLKHADTLRALILLNSDHMELSNLGYAWLQGYGVAEDAMEVYGFNIREKKPSAVVEGLSWLMSLRSPIVVALDQLDPFVAEHHALASVADIPEEHLARQVVSRSIIDNIGRGLTELRDMTRRTLSVVTCLAETWTVLGSYVLKSALDRFEPPRFLGSLRDRTMAEHLVGARLSSAYARVGFSPPYPRWPFAPSAFASIASGGKSPRELLKVCDQHQRRCSERREVTDLVTFVNEDRVQGEDPSPVDADLAPLDRDLERLYRTTKVPAKLLREGGEDDLGRLLFAGCEVLCAERLPDRSTVELAIDAESGGNRHCVALHARVRQILVKQNDRELHLCLRAILRDNPIAFQSRLNAALTASGIDRKLPYRKLILVRNEPVPTGAKTTALVAKARSAGADIVPATEEDLRTILALKALREEQKGKREAFEQWLRARRPASQIALLKPIADWLAPAPTTDVPPRPAPAPVVPLGTVNPPSPVLSVAVTTSTTVEVIRPAPLPPVSAAPQPATRPMIAVGHQVIADKRSSPRAIPAEDLRQHVVVLAGAGSGKTVLLKRLVEEAALLGIPSIVVDGANDLSRLGEPWPARPSTFTDEDAAKADRYHSQTDVIVWTPGRSSGNPLRLGLLPDFASVAADPDELNQAVAMTVSAMAGMLGKKVDEKARAILGAALRVFVREGGGDLATFLGVLADLPEEASLQISTARKIATALNDQLRAAIANNPLLREEGEPLDPGVLFGVGAPRPRVSVLSLVGLPGGDAPLQFVNQLAMTLFTWVKKNPCPADRPLRGLLVLDEAKDFVPSQSSTPCKESLIRLAAQGRKYGLGVVFASQAPKSIDHNVIANASTQFFGKASSPAAIDTVEEQLRVRGAQKSDVATLPKGRFYLAGKEMPAPIKIEVPLCLSHHPASPPDEADVLRRAAASRLG